MPAVVDLEKCDGCGACVEECPVECISLVEDDPGSAPHGREQHAVVNNEECTDCEVCIDVCEQGALSMVEELMVAEEEAFRALEPVIENKQVFISYDEEDDQFTQRLADDLQQLGVRIWIASESIRPGELFVDAINRGLEESSYMLIVLTPAALDSWWVRTEASVAFDLEGEGRMQVIPIVLKPCKVPPLWRSHQMIPFHRDYDTGFKKLVNVFVTR